MESIMQKIAEKEPPATQRELRKNERKAAIEKASTKIFLEKGFSAASVDEIAALAQVTKRTLYSYYPSKLALFIHLVDDHLQRLTKELAKAAGKKGTIEERLMALLRALFDFTRKNEKFMWLYWMLDSGEADGVLPKELVEHVQWWTEAMFRVAVQVVKEGQEEGRLRDFDPRLVAHLISAVNKGIVIQASKERRFEIDDISSAKLQELFRQLIMGGIFVSAGDAKPAMNSPGKSKK